MNKKYTYLVSAQRVAKPGDTVEIKEVNNMNKINKIKITSQETIDIMEAAHAAARLNLKGAVPRSAIYASEVVYPEYVSFKPTSVQLPKEAKIDFSCRTFDGAEFNCQCFDGYNFSHGIFRGSTFSGSSLRDTNFSYANLTRSNFTRADLRMACLRGANLIYADFDSADLRGADLTEAQTFGATFDGAKIDEATKGLDMPMTCPSEGSFIGWKKALIVVSVTPDTMEEEEALVKLEIPEDAKRSSSTTYKCRANKAKVLDIVSIDRGLHSEIAFSFHDRSFIYRLGEMVEVPDFDENRFNECAAGIHFFVSKETAIAYGM